MKAERLTPKAAQTALSALHPDWQIAEGVLTRRLKTRNFAASIGLTVQIAALAEDYNHHPDLKIGWGYCEISLTTHDAGGLTAKDFNLAADLDATFAS